MNPKLADFCRHYGMTPMPCRSYTPQHKGKVERGVAYAKNNALKGRQFASLGEQNAHLLHWEEQVADKAMDAAASLPAFRAIKHLLEAGDQAPGQIQMKLREVDPIIRPFTAYADFIRSQAPGGDNIFHSETTILTEPQTPSKAS
jgi:hypothetical protein